MAGSDGRRETLREHLRRSGQVRHPGASARAHGAAQARRAHQRALTRYYFAAGAGGIAVGVHTTQFAIRDAKHGLYARSSSSRRTTARARWRGSAAADHRAVRARRRRRRPHARRRCTEAELAAALGYDAGLLSLGALARRDRRRRCSRTAASSPTSIPLVRLLSAARGRRHRVLDYAFWREFAEIPNVVGDQDRAVQPLSDDRRRARGGRSRARRHRALHGQRRQHRRATSHAVPVHVGGDDAALDRRRAARPVGGVDAPRRRAARDQGARRERASMSPPTLLAHGAALTDANAAVFDARHGFAGCIAGHPRSAATAGAAARHLVPRSARGLSPGQAEEIDRVMRCLPRAHGRRVRRHAPGQLAGLSALPSAPRPVARAMTRALDARTRGATPDAVVMVVSNTGVSGPTRPSAASSLNAERVVDVHTAVRIAVVHATAAQHRRAEHRLEPRERPEQPIDRTPRRAGRRLIDTDRQEPAIAPLTSARERRAMRVPLAEKRIDGIEQAVPTPAA